MQLQLLREICAIMIHSRSLSGKGHGGWQMVGARAIDDMRNQPVVCPVLQTRLFRGDGFLLTRTYPPVLLDSLSDRYVNLQLLSCWLGKISYLFIFRWLLLIGCSQSKR